MPELIVSIPHLGQVRGQTSHEVTVFKGVPYAAPPTGAWRWKPPRPVEPWNEIRSADGFGAGCLQLAPPGYSIEPGCSYSEDCLYLNIWRPKLASDGSRLPVMVWIHGGGFIFSSGASPITDGVNLARHGVIIISINYRLGRFGWFAHPELSHEAGQGPTANFGLMDQIAALRWVQENIAAFGGDPKNVTIFGVSAGARSVHMLMSAAPASGLFAKAIAQTSGPRMQFRDLGTAEQYGRAFADAVGASNLATLRSLPADVILNTDMPPEHETAPILDGRLIVEQVDRAFERGLPMPIPHLIGTNDFEASNWADALTDPDAVLSTLPSDARELVAKLYGTDAKADPTAIAAGVITDRVCTEPARFVAQMHAARGLPVYRYLFGYVPERLRGRVRGAGHATEQPFVFGNLDAVPSWKGLGTETDRQTAEMIGHYWTNFARTGDPNGPGLTHWPKDGADQLLHFASDGPRSEAAYLKSRLDFWAHEAGA